MRLNKAENAIQKSAEVDGAGEVLSSSTCAAQTMDDNQNLDAMVSRINLLVSSLGQGL